MDAYQPDVLEALDDEEYDKRIKAMKKLPLREYIIAKYLILKASMRHPDTRADIRDEIQARLDEWESRHPEEWVLKETDTKVLYTMCDMLGPLYC
jgi:hypothetical protein